MISRSDKVADKATRLHTVTVYLPEEANHLFRELDRKCGMYADVVQRPHLTLGNPFVPKAPISLMVQKLRALASRAAPFSLRCSGIRYFEDWNNCAYIPVHNERQITDLHFAVYASIGNLLEDKYQGKLNLDGYVPHVSIAVNIEADKLPHVKRALVGHSVEFECPVTAFELCAQREDRTWETLETFRLRDATDVTATVKSHFEGKAGRVLKPCTQQ